MPWDMHRLTGRELRLIAAYFDDAERPAGAGYGVVPPGADTLDWSDES